MSEQVRLLLYPLGFLSTLFFALRFIIQWLASERKKESVVPKNFWFFSLSGNLSLALHAAIQLQFPILLLQSIAALISIRNLNLLTPKPLSLRTTLTLGGGVLLLITLLFFSHSTVVMRAPLQNIAPLPLMLHIIGSGGMLLFASRFWLQWWHAERAQKSTLTRSFWWMSLLGAGLSLIYFVALKDPVNMLGYSVGILPYLRNLALIRKRTFNFKSTNTLFVVAAETSGERLGAHLITQLKEKMQETRFVGVGSEEMKKAGLIPLISSSEFEVMGLSALFPAAFRLFRNFHTIKRLIAEEKPKMVILIDYAEFNMLLAKALRKGGYRGKIVQYVVPSVWAWRRGRINSLARNYDLLLSILPFEKAYFKDKNIKVSFVGHPLTNAIENFIPQWKKREPLIALFPGSRLAEIKENLPYQLQAAQKLLQKEPQPLLAISVAQKKLEGPIKKIASAYKLPYKLVKSGSRYELMHAATVALSTCGTVILELALFNTATVVCYKISYLNYLVGRFLFRIKLSYFSLPNIILQRELFPEHIDKKIKYETLVEMAEHVMTRKHEIREGCREMKNALCYTERSEASDEVYKLFMS